MPKERPRRKKKAKEWYNVVAPPIFGKAKIAETPSDDSEKLIGRNISISLQELTNDFSKSHIKLQFKVVAVKGLEAHTIFIGHMLTSDYVKRMSRRHKSKIDGTFDVTTKDGLRLRIKPSALAGKRILTSQKREIRAVMKNEIEKEAAAKNFNAIVKDMLDGELGKNIHKSSKTVYPIRRIEIWKSHLLEIPHVEITAEEEIEEEIKTTPPEDLSKEAHEEIPEDAGEEESEESKEDAGEEEVSVEISEEESAEIVEEKSEDKKTEGAEKIGKTPEDAGEEEVSVEISEEEPAEIVEEKSEDKKTEGAEEAPE